MKLCIQDTVTNQYFQGPFTWVQDRAVAYNFENSLEAIDMCQQMNQGRKPQVLLSFEGSQQDVCLFPVES